MLRRRFLLFAALALLMPALRVRAQQPAAPRAWIKSDSKLIVALEVAQYLDGAEVDKIAEISSLHPIVLSWWLGEAEKFAGVTRQDVTRVVISEELPAGFVFAVETTGEAPARQLIATLTPGATAALTPLGPHTAGDQYGLLQLDPHAVLVSSPPAAIEAVVERLTNAPAGTTALPPFAAGEAPPLVDVFLQPTFLTSLPGFEQAPPQLAALLEASALRVRFEPLDGELTFRFVANYADETKAGAGVVALKFIAEQLTVYMDMCAENMPAALQGFEAEHPSAAKLKEPLLQAIAAAKAGLQAPTAETVGTTAHMVCRIKSAQPVTDAILLLSLAPRAVE
jgi:hypothetical protein